MAEEDDGAEEQHADDRRMGMIGLTAVVILACVLVMFVGALEMKTTELKIQKTKSKVKKSELTKMERIYISGPITGYNKKERKKVFAAAAEMLKSKGYEVVNPMEEEPEGLTWKEYMRRDIEKLVKCDAIYMLPSWKESRGATVENMLAETLGMEIMEEIERSIYVEVGGEKEVAVRKFICKEDLRIYGCDECCMKKRRALQSVQLHRTGQEGQKECVL